MGAGAGQTPLAERPPCADGVRPDAGPRARRGSRQRDRDAVAGRTWLAGRRVGLCGQALQDGAEAAAKRGLADRVTWLHADLSVWSPAPARYDLVACLYVHVVGSAQDLVRRLAGGVIPGGTLLLVGHHPAPGQVQVSVSDAAAVLEGWKFVVAEERTHASGSGMDALVRAIRPA